MKFERKNSKLFAKDEIKQRRTEAASLPGVPLLLERGTRGVPGLYCQALHGDALLVSSFPLFTNENVTACQRKATSEARIEGKKIAFFPYSSITTHNCSVLPNHSKQQEKYNKNLFLTSTP